MGYIVTSLTPHLAYKVLLFLVVFSIKGQKLCFLEKKQNKD